MSVFMHDKIHKAKDNTILSEGKNLSLMEWFKVKFNDNTFLMMDCGYLLIIVLIVWISYKKMLNLFFKHVKEVCKTQNMERKSIDMDMTNEIDGSSTNDHMKPVRIASRQVHVREIQWFNDK